MLSKIVDVFGTFDEGPLCVHNSTPFVTRDRIRDGAQERVVLHAGEAGGKSTGVGKVDGNAIVGIQDAFAIDMGRSRINKAINLVACRKVEEIVHFIDDGIPTSVNSVIKRLREGRHIHGVALDR